MIVASAPATSGPWPVLAGFGSLPRPSTGLMDLSWLGRESLGLVPLAASYDERRLVLPDEIAGGNWAGWSRGAVAALLLTALNAPGTPLEGRWLILPPSKLLIDGIAARGA
jgi:hypothetical protein